MPNKNIKLLKGKPLISYSIEIARRVTEDEHICVSTDSLEIAAVVESTGLKIPFLRPPELASDTTGSREVIVHALDYYAQLDREYDMVVLLQPTSPFRRLADVQAMITMFESGLDMVVSVSEPHVNPYFSLFEENASGFLELSKKGSFTRRQDCPKVYAYNGSVYVINTESIRHKNFSEFSLVRKFIMNEINSVDIDNQFDWWIAEMILEKSIWEAQ